MNVNGGGKSRLDRIEEMLERSEARNAQQALENEAAHDIFRKQHQKLLRTQYKMEDTMKRQYRELLTNQVLMSDTLTKTVETLTKTVEAMRELELMVRKLDLKMLETTEKLDALIRIVDGFIRRPGIA